MPIFEKQTRTHTLPQKCGGIFRHTHVRLSTPNVHWRVFWLATHASDHYADFGKMWKLYTHNPILTKQ